MWGSIVALHGRYPDELRGLQQGWWNDTSQVETLCALVVWRDTLDDAGGDPREELDFQLNVAEFGRKARPSRAAASRRHGHPAHPGRVDLKITPCNPAQRSPASPAGEQGT